MSPRFLDDPAHWHLRADEMRRLADQETDIIAREMMLRIVLDYERLAERAEVRNDIAGKSKD